MSLREGASPWGCLRAVVLVFLLFAAVTVGGVAYVGLRVENITEEVPATVLPVEGQAQILKADTATWMPALELLPLSSGDAIRVGDASGALLYFFDGTRVHLGPNAQLTVRTSVRHLDRPPLLGPLLKQVIPDYPGPLEARAQVTIRAVLNSGPALVYVGRPATPDSHFRTETNNTAIQATSAVYAVTVDAERGTLVEALSGQATVAGLATFRDEAHGVALTLLQPGHGMYVTPTPADAAGGEIVDRQRAAAWSILDAAVRNGAAPASLDGLAMVPAVEDNTVATYRLLAGPPPTPTPVPTIAPDDGTSPALPSPDAPSEEQSEQPEQDEEPPRDLPEGFGVAPIEEIGARAARAQELLQPRGISVRSLTEKDLRDQLPGGSGLRVQGGGVVTANVQGLAYTLTIRAAGGALSIGGLPPGVNVPEMPVQIIAVASEPGEVIVVYREVQ